MTPSPGAAAGQAGQRADSPAAVQPPERVAQRLGAELDPAGEVDAVLAEQLARVAGDVGAGRAERQHRDRRPAHPVGEPAHPGLQQVGRRPVRRPRFRHGEASEQHEIQARILDRRVQCVVDRGHRRGARVSQHVAGHVQRVARVGERRQVRGDRRRRLGRERRDLDAFRAGPVGDDVAGTAGRGQHAHPAAARPALIAEQRRGREQVFDAGHPDDVELAQRGVHHGVIAGYRTGVRERGRLPGLARADLHRDDRLARLVGALRRSAERCRVADLFKEHADDLGLLVRDQVVEHVGGGDHRLVAERGDRADADRLRAGEGQQRAGQRAALQRDARPGPEVSGSGTVSANGAALAAVLRKPSVFGPEQHDAVPGSRGDEFVLEFPAAAAAFPVTRGKHDHVPDPGGSRILDHGRDRLGGRQNERQVGGLGQVAQAAHGRTAEDRLVPRVHRQQRAGVPDGAAGRDDEPGPAGGLRRPDEGDAARREELGKPLRRDQLPRGLRPPVVAAPALVTPAPAAPWAGRGRVRR